MNKQKVAAITGISGQDGSYLAEFLLEKGYKVYGLVRRNCSNNYKNISHLLDKIEIIYGNMTDQKSLDNFIKKSMPDEVYNLAANSFVKLSWSQPESVFNINSIGVVRLLESIKEFKPDAKFYQASSSEMFGNVLETPQNEDTKFNPASPYGVSKAFSFYITQVYRKSYGIFTCNGTLFNHESERRGIEFVTKKITDGVARIKLGLAKELKLGNIDSIRDWGYSPDFVKSMWLMMQQDKPDDYVIATGETHSVKDFLRICFEYVNLDWKDYVIIDEEFFRPCDVNLLKGDCSKAKKILGWEPETNFKEMVIKMLEYDLKRLSKDKEKK